MKKIITILLTTICIIVAQSCKKDSPTIPVKQTPPTKTETTPEEKPDPSKIYLVSNISIANGHYTTLQQLLYDTKNRLIEFRIKDSDQIYWDEVYIYTYDDSNRMIKREYYGANGKLINTVEYKYTTADDPKDGFVAVDANNHITGMNTDYLVKYDTQGHILFYGSAIWYQPGTNYGVMYDDKNNPFKNMVGVNPHFNNQEHNFPAITTNNVLNTFDNGNWMFQYNIDNYPTSMSYFNKDGVEIKVTYDYIIK